VFDRKNYLCGLAAGLPGSASTKSPIVGEGVARSKKRSHSVRIGDRAALNLEQDAAKLLQDQRPDQSYGDPTGTGRVAGMEMCQKPTPRCRQAKAILTKTAFDPALFGNLRRDMEKASCAPNVKCVGAQAGRPRRHPLQIKNMKSISFMATAIEI